MYDYLIVGAGLFGSVFTLEMTKAGYTCMVIDKRDHVGGNIYTENISGINVHRYGAHIFHTSDRYIWEYIGRYAEFNRYTNSPVARYRDELYNLPFNMNTFNKLWGVVTPKEAKDKIEEQIRESGITNPSNLEEQAISLVGKDIYEKLIKGYTEKQWGKKAHELPSFIIKRIPVRFTYDNNYFNDLYQGIPIGGYTPIIEKMLDGADVRLNADYFSDKKYYDSLAGKVVFTGMIDEYFDYCYGRLEYRTLEFENEIINTDNYQGNAVVNYTEYEIPYTRIIEHRHFEDTDSGVTVITREYPGTWTDDSEPYYPVNDDKNNTLYERYRSLAAQTDNVIFGGRLGMYRYFDMHNVIREALDCAEKEKERRR